jgi:phosphoglycerate dehydrogenase-like enzyme
MFTIGRTVRRRVPLSVGSVRIVFGRLGLIGSPAGDRIRELEPEWELIEATGSEWPAALGTADIAVPVISPLGAAELDGSSVRFVQQFGVGLDSVDLAACAQHHIPVANVPSSASGNATAVAELAVLMTLALVRDLDGARAAVRGQGPQLGFTHSLAGRRIVLIGLGGIGREIAARLAPFRVQVHAVRAHPDRGGAPGVDEVHDVDDLDALLNEADGVILCAPPGPGPLFTAERFATLRPGAFLVNVARGTLIDEHALLDALNDGTLAGAALDVLTEEPAAPDSPLVQHPRVITTPHIGGVTLENLTSTAEALVENIRRFSRQEPIRWQQ